MINWMFRNKKKLIIIGVISILIPLLYLTYIVLSSDSSSTSITLHFNSFLSYFLVAYYVLLFTFLIAFAMYWLVKNIKLIFSLKNEKTKTELMHLKTQVNPHFFFNMLNNLYGLVDKDSEKAKKLILKLSDMMRYSIYEGQKDKVTLNEEIEFITNFIELHKMRYHKSIDVSFILEVKNEDIKVMPLLFIILVENAFKHGVEVLRKEAFVIIKLKATTSKIYFEIENNFDVENKREDGIGLKNLKRRLELVFPKQHNFLTSIKTNIFKATLEIEL